MTVRAKFKCHAVERTKNGDEEMQTIKLNPVYANNDPEHENSKFWKYSPSGSISLGTINPAAAAYFELGGEYYIDFTKAESA